MEKSLWKTHLQKKFHFDKNYTLLVNCKYICPTGATYNVVADRVKFSDTPYIKIPTPKLNFQYLRDNNESLSNYSKFDENNQAIEIDEQVKILKSISKNNNLLLQQAIMLNQLFYTTRCEGYKKETGCKHKLANEHKKVMKKMNEIINCESILDTILKDTQPDKMIVLVPLGILHSSANKHIHSDE